VHAFAPCGPHGGLQKRRSGTLVSNHAGVADYYNLSSPSALQAKVNVEPQGYEFLQETSGLVAGRLHFLQNVPPAD
jgi:hypothetical protein